MDEVLLTLMAAPRSYTREDVVEIHTHGGHAAVQAVLELVIRQGAAPAASGEFTRRAFLNGRIDLSQAEAVMEIVNARSAKALQLALSQLAGGLKALVENLHQGLLTLAASLEAALDFPEDVEETPVLEQTQRQLHEVLLPELDALLNRCEKGRWYRDGLKLAVVGPPNTGKSSLVNALLEQNRVIVSEHAGTTRDVVEALFEIDGIPVCLADTAGIHETSEPLERLGIARTHACMQEADVVLLVVDVNAGSDATADLLADTRLRRPDILVVNKIDLLPADRPAYELPTDESLPTVLISALYRRNLDELKRAIGVHLHNLRDGDDAGEAMLCNIRHRRALENCREALLRAADILVEAQLPELAATDIRDGLSCLESITGTATDALLLDTIFNTFCIGK